MSKVIYCLRPVLDEKNKRLSMVNSGRKGFIKEIGRLEKLGKQKLKEDYEKRLQALESEKKILEDVIERIYVIEIIKAGTNDCVNGLLGMGRDVIMKLITIFGKEFGGREKIKMVIGIGQESVRWVALPIFRLARDIDVIIQRKTVKIPFIAGAPSFSDPFHMFGKEWEAAVTPDGDYDVNLHLDCKSFEASDSNTSENFQIVCQIFLLNNLSPLLRRGRGGICSFSRNNDRFENAKFISTSFLDEKHGYLKEETLHVEIVMIASGNKPLLEKEVKEDTFGIRVVLDEVEGCVYYGDLLKGKKWGRGTAISKARIYIGDWKDGKEDGLGEEILCDGGIYKGGFSEGKWSGKGVHVDSSGESYDGSWSWYKEGEAKFFNNFWFDGVTPPTTSFFSRIW